jgi:hypothetical protein
MKYFLMVLVELVEEQFQFFTIFGDFFDNFVALFVPMVLAKHALLA